MTALAAVQPPVAEVGPILAQYPDASADMLIPILQEVQERLGYLSRDAIVQVGRYLGIPTSRVYGVATFYNQFRFKPLGRYHVQVCRGTACHVKGSVSLLDALKQELSVQAGETTEDGLFSLEIVACIGACGLAPVLCINGEFYAEMTPGRVRDLLEDFRERASAHEDA